MQIKVDLITASTNPLNAIFQCLVHPVKRTCGKKKFNANYEQRKGTARAKRGYDCKPLPYICLADIIAISFVTII